MSTSRARPAVNGTFLLGRLRVPSNICRYSCPLTSKSKFVGCCQTEADPCSTGCAAGALQPATYNGTYHEKFPDASCADPALFYTCGLNADGSNTFWGCCKSNPCANGAVCPSGSLDGAYIGKPEQVAFYVSSELVSSALTSATSTASPTSAPNSDDGGSSNGAVIGGAVGGAVGALRIFGLVVFFLWHRRRNAKAARGGDNVEVASPMMSDPKAFDPHSPNMAARSRKHPSRIITHHALTQEQRHQHTLPLMEITTRVWHHKAKSTRTLRAHMHKISGLTTPIVHRKWRQMLACRTVTPSSLLRLSDPPHITGTQSCRQGPAVASHPTTRPSLRKAKMNRCRQCHKGWVW